MHRRRWRRALVILLVLFLVGETGRRLALSHSLYRLNLSEVLEMRDLDPPRMGERVVIFAPHEDDEVLGCAGYIQKAVKAGAHVRVVLITNGEYPELSVLLAEKTLPLRPAEFVRLGYSRQRETLAALGSLGLPKDAVTFLGYPNNYLDRMWLPSHWVPWNPVRSQRTATSRSPYANSFTPKAIYCGQSLLEDIKAILTRERPDVVITIHPDDMHVDHWPTYCFVRLALEELGLRDRKFVDGCRVYTYLIHWPGWPAPRRYRPWLRLAPPAVLATGATEWRALPLTMSETLNKHAATASYKSQGGNYDQLLASFARVNELFGVLSAVSWPTSAELAARTVIQDPAREFASSASHPRADIVTVAITRVGKRMLVEVSTREKADPRTLYHLSVHVAGCEPADRRLALYTWSGAKAEGTTLEAGALRPVAPAELTRLATGTRSYLLAPWPAPSDRGGSLLCRAWTTRMGRLIDQTAVVTLRWSTAPATGHPAR
ncbi:MAG: PIG-L family deacetylase [Armatimonadetes bacterium]|nr:PIG-L family deacetylase [Armatimonadota bacterium]